MNVWWLAIDTDHTSYELLKERKVIAQGWKLLGDLRTLCPLAKNNEEVVFKDVIRKLAKIAYGECAENITRAPKALWPFFKVQRDDLLVGIEGKKVCGICQAGYAATESYRYETNSSEYAQTICSPVEWFDWNADIMGPPPAAPSRLLAISHIQNEQDQVVEAWQRLKA